jgi:Ca2+/Na+ antiporter
MTVLTYLPYYVITGSAGIIAAILLGLRAALADWPARERKSVVRTAAFLLIGWFAAAVALAWLGMYRGAADRVPTIEFGLLVPILIGAWMIWRSPIVARVIDAVPQQSLVGVQFYRALGAMFLILYAADKLPGLFALPAGLGDVLVGLSAPVIAAAYARNPETGAVWNWNVLGIADLVVAVATGFVTSPSPVQLFALDAPNELISAFPLVLVPTFLVPISIILHFASLTKLRRATGRRIRDRAISIHPG